MKAINRLKKIIEINSCTPLQLKLAKQQLKRLENKTTTN